MRLRQGGELRAGDAVRVWQLAPECSERGCTDTHLAMTNGPTGEAIAPRLNEVKVATAGRLELELPAYSVVIARVTLRVR